MAGMNGLGSLRELLAWYLIPTGLGLSGLGLSHELFNRPLSCVLQDFASLDHQNTLTSAVTATLLWQLRFSAAPSVAPPYPSAAGCKLKPPPQIVTSPAREQVCRS